MPLLNTYKLNNGWRTYCRGLMPKNTNNASPESSHDETGAHITSNGPSTSTSCTCFKSRHRYQPLVHVQGRDPHSPWHIHLWRRHGTNNVSTIHEPITSRPSPRPCCTMSPTLTVVNAVYAQHSTSCIHHPTATPKTMPSRGTTTPKVPSSPDPVYPPFSPRVHINPRVTFVVETTLVASVCAWSTNYW
jgi:hypothetical protein